MDGHGESTLRKLFQAVFPAGAGEFVASLSPDVYSKDLPALTRLPGLIEIEMVLLNGYVELVSWACEYAQLTNIESMQI